MACSCRHRQQDIEEYQNEIKKLRDLFISRMTVDSKTQDARRREFNQAIFGFRDDGSSYAVWNETTLEMVLQCFDDAVKDWRRTFCDVENCRRK